MFHKLLERIKSSIDIKQSERDLFRLLYLHSFLIGLASAFFFVEASRNFILKISLAEIPAAYIFSGIAGYLLIRLFKFWQRRFGPAKSFELILIVFCCVMVLLFISRWLWDDHILFAKVVAYVGFVLIFAFVTLFAVGFAGICLSIFNLSQSKRLLALLGTGEIIASILGYLIIPVLVSLMGNSSYLLILSALCSLLAIVPIRKVSVEAKPMTMTVTKKSPAASSFNLSLIIKNPFILYLSLTTLFSIVTVYFIDYSYLVSVRYFSSVTGVEVATVVAMLFSVIKTGELFFSFFSSNIISAIGMKRSVLLLPILLIGGAVLGGFSLIFFSASPIFIIFFLFINKWIDRVVRKGVTIPTTKIMFQINTPEERVQLQNNIDGVISQLSTMICGVLLVVMCYFTDTTDYNAFLKVTTVVGLFVFVIFLLFTTKLYAMYKVRIHEYLKSSKVIKPDIDSLADLVKTNLTIDQDNLFSQQLHELMKDTDLLNKRKLRSFICSYNPSAIAYLNFTEDQVESEDEILRKITKLYFENQNVFSRILIISYFNCFDFRTQINFFKDVERVTPLRLRAYFLKRLCATGKSVDETEVFYFSELIAESISEMLWTEAAIEDLKELPNQKLSHQLGMHREELTQILLHFIELLHDRHSVSLVRDIINNKERNEDDMLFIVELLENILRPELKKLVLPVFEPISVISRRNKMQKIFFFNSLDVNDRLLDILMHDFNTVDHYSKQLALEALRERDKESIVIKAFCSSRIDNLKSIAMSRDIDPVYNANILQRNSISSQFCKSFRLDDHDKVQLERWGLKDCLGTISRDENKKPSERNLIHLANSSMVNHFWEIDLLAPVLLHKMQVA